MLPFYKSQKKHQILFFNTLQSYQTSSNLFHIQHQTISTKIAQSQTQTLARPPKSSCASGRKNGRESTGSLESWPCLPSGKVIFGYGKSPCLMGKSTTYQLFRLRRFQWQTVTNYQRLNCEFTHVLSQNRLKGTSNTIPTLNHIDGIMQKHEELIDDQGKHRQCGILQVFTLHLPDVRVGMWSAWLFARCVSMAIWVINHLLHCVYSIPSGELT